MNRRGFSLAELMVALVMAGIIGIALTRLLINQSRFVASQEGMMKARAGARAGFNVALQELRTVTMGGVVAATRDSITIRVPYAYGVACKSASGGRRGVAVFPYDSATYASSTMNGYAWRDAVGNWTFEEGGVVSAGAANDCLTASPQIGQVPGGSYIRVTTSNAATPIGQAVYLFKTVKYVLTTSVDVPGRIALWRRVPKVSLSEELVTPFDTSSRFGFLTGNGLTYSASPPAVLDSLRGIRMRLVAQSEAIPEGRTTYSSFDLSTDVIFINRAP